ncbi:MAG: hypothetical protein KGI67_15515 [Pseudomonadota bacterium]|nr:hypothetical protein [Pseudomonadota bacterium]
MHSPRERLFTLFVLACLALGAASPVARADAPADLPDATAVSLNQRLQTQFHDWEARARRITADQVLRTEDLRNTLQRVGGESECHEDAFQSDAALAMSRYAEFFQRMRQASLDDRAERESMAARAEDDAQRLRKRQLEARAGLAHHLADIAKARETLAYRLAVNECLLRATVVAGEAGKALGDLPPAGDGQPAQSRLDSARLQLQALHQQLHAEPGRVEYLMDMLDAIVAYPQ